VEWLVPTWGSVPRRRGPHQQARARWRQLPAARPDGVSHLKPLFLWFRWGALAVGWLLVLVEHAGPTAMVAGGVLLANTIWRTKRPIGFDKAGPRPYLALLFEVGVSVAAVEATGFGRSPFLASLGVSTAVAGFAGGVSVVLQLAVLAGLAVVIPSVLLPSYQGVASLSAESAIGILLAGVIGGISRYVMDDTVLARARLDSRAAHLGKVNDLLFDLHHATLSEPTPLDVDGASRLVLRWFDELFEADVSAVAVRDPSSGQWRLSASKGIAVRGDWSFQPLEPMLQASQTNQPLMMNGLQEGLSYRSRWGLYSALKVRGNLIGVLALESEQTRPFDIEGCDRVAELSKAAAFAIHNAYLLDKIRAIGVEEERLRIARELHDCMAQSIVYLGLEVDRLIDLNHGRNVRSDLQSFRSDLTELIRQLRDALVDLRSDVSESRNIEAALQSMVDRVNARKKVLATLSIDVSDRLPIAVEREFLRVGQEALTNAERHARASKIQVVWRCRHGLGALLEVTDDGRGLRDRDPRHAGYGLTGMRERARSVQATLEILSNCGPGTTVRMHRGLD